MWPLLQVHGHVAEPSNLHVQALDSEDEAVPPQLPRGHGHSSAGTQLERDGGRARCSTGRAARLQFTAR